VRCSGAKARRNRSDRETKGRSAPRGPAAGRLSGRAAARVPALRRFSTLWRDARRHSKRGRGVRRVSLGFRRLPSAAATAAEHGRPRESGDCRVASLLAMTWRNVIASASHSPSLRAKRSNLLPERRRPELWRLPRRFVPRNDMEERHCQRFTFPVIASKAKQSTPGTPSPGALEIAASLRSRNDGEGSPCTPPLVPVIATKRDEKLL
jgi:hypothetical protein